MNKEEKALKAILEYADEQYEKMMPRLEKLYKHTEKLVNESREWRKQLKKDFPSFF